MEGGRNPEVSTHSSGSEETIEETLSLTNNSHMDIQSMVTSGT